MRVTDIQALTNEAINQMTNDELIEAVKSASRFVKQRESYLESFSGSSPALRGLKQQIGNIPTQTQTQSMSVNELRHVLTNERYFLNAQTSTLPGARQRYRNIILSTIDTDGLTDRQVQNRITRKINKLGGYRKIDEMLEMIDRIRELDPALEYQIGTNPERGSGYFQNVVETYLQDPEIQNDPVLLAERVRQRYEELQMQRAMEEDFEF